MQTVGLRCIRALLTYDAGRDFHVDHRPAPRPIEETPKDFRFLSIRASHFRIGVGELRRGRRPDLARDPHTECADGQDRHNVVYTVEFSCASTDANCDDAVLTVDVPRFANPDGAVNSEVAPVLAAATNTTGVVAPPTIAPEASFAASSATQASAKASTTVDGSADLSILKSGHIVPPVKGVEVIYTLRASYAAAMDATGKYTGVPAVGHVNADDVVVYDVLPHLGDRGVGPAASNARGSQWQPRLAGPVAVADSDVPRDKVKIQYSTSENACRGEATAQGAARAAGPAGCVDDWTDSPASFGDVRAVRAEFANRATRSGPMTRRPACGPSSPTDRPRVRCPLEPLRPSSSA